MASKPNMEKVDKDSDIESSSSDDSSSSDSSSDSSDDESEEDNSKIETIDKKDDKKTITNKNTVAGRKTITDKFIGKHYKGGQKVEPIKKKDEKKEKEEEKDEEVNESEHDSSSEESESESEEEVEETGPAIPSNLSFASRKSFPFSYWFYCPRKDRYSAPEDSLIQRLKEATLDILKKVLVVDENEYDMYIIRGSHEKDRLRVICPTVWVNSHTALNIRTLLLEELGYKANAEVIPITIYRFHTASPSVLLERQFDMGTAKLEARQTYVCYLHRKMKTEILEKKLNYWASYDPIHPHGRTKFTKMYTSFLETMDDHSPYENKDEYMTDDAEMPPTNDLEEELFGAILDSEIEDSLHSSQKISEEMKKKFGDKIDRCINLFHKYHPKSKLRSIRLYKEKFYIFDFTKSDSTCQICKVSHKGNRQYLVFSPELQKAYYHCHDTEASGKSIIWSVKDPIRGADVVIAGM